MKHLLLIIALFLTSNFAIAQEGVIVTMHAVVVEGDLQAFEEVESKYMKKVAQHAAEKAIFGLEFIEGCTIRRDQRRGPV